VKDIFTLEGGLRKFLIDASEALDMAEDELLILEEDLGSDYSNSGGPAENEERLVRVLESFEALYEGATKFELEEMEGLSKQCVEACGRLMRDGDLDLTIERMEALLGCLDAMRDILDSLDTTGKEGKDASEVLELLEASLVD
jgi:two-component system chemotaxis sensor kinase CheA